MQVLKTFIFSFFLMLSVSAVQAQVEEWTPIIENKGGLYISRKNVEWQDVRNGLHQEVIVLRLENRSTGTLLVEWDEELYYNDVCRTCGQSPEYHRTLAIAPGQTIEGELDAMKTGKGLRIFVKALNRKNSSVLTDYKMANLEVSER